MIFKNKQINALILSVITIVVLGSLFPPTSTQAAPISIAFGGKVTSMVPCTCSSGYQVTITAPLKYAGTYLYLPGVTRLYKQNTVIPNVYLLGRYIPGGVCLVTASPCAALPITKGTIDFIGTSFP